MSLSLPVFFFSTSLFPRLPSCSITNFIEVSGSVRRHEMNQSMTDGETLELFNAPSRTREFFQSSHRQPPPAKTFFAERKDKGYE